MNKKITLLLGALYGFILLHVNAGENIFWGNLQPVFQAGYLDNNYRIVYLLENETIIAVERIIEKDSGKEFLQFEAVGKRSFATIRMEVEGRHWVTLKTKTENLSKTGDEAEYLKTYEKIINGGDGKKTVLIDSKFPQCNTIHHRFKDQTEIETSLESYAGEKGANSGSDHIKGVQVMTGNSPNFPARLNIIPDATYAYYIWSEQTETINKKEIQNKKISKNPQDVALIGMYYYAQNPPQLEEAVKYFNSAYELLPENKRELQDGLDLETFQILAGKDRLSEKEKIKRSFAQDPLVLITNILTQEQQIKEDLAFLEEQKKLQKTNNLVTVRKVVQIPLTNTVVTGLSPTNKVTIRKRVAPYKESSTNPQ